MAEHLSQSPAFAGSAFRTTQWSMVINAGSDDSLVAVEALDQLSQRYWYPLYASVRPSGYSHGDAADLTQSFFARVVERRIMAGVEPGVARFRTFLLTALKRFIINEWQSANRLKRGGGKQIVSLDEKPTNFTAQNQRTTPHPISFLRSVGLCQSLIWLWLSCEQNLRPPNGPDLFDALKPALSGDKLEKSYAEVGSTFGLSEGAIKVAVHRMRKRFVELIRSENAETVRDGQDVEDEMRYLITVLGG